MKKRDAKPVATIPDTETDKDLRQRLIVILNKDKTNRGGDLLGLSTEEMLVRAFSRRTKTPEHVARQVPYEALKVQFNKTATPRWGRNALIAFVVSPAAALVGGLTVLAGSSTLEGALGGGFGTFFTILGAGTLGPMGQSTYRSLRNRFARANVTNRALEYKPEVQQRPALPPPAPGKR